MKQTKLIVGNWKMNKTAFEAGILSLELVALLKGMSEKEVQAVVCPSFVCLDRVAGFIKNSNILLGAQDLYIEKEGAFTGEVSGAMLKDVGARYVIVGHSERRGYFGEDDELVNKKAAAAIECGLVPIICVGESEGDRDEGKEFDVVKGQLKAATSGLEKGSYVVAYEPVWAIGTGKTASGGQADQMCEFIKGVVGKDTKVLYGGSMNAGNAKELLNRASIDGGLIGGASLKADEFVRIIRACPKV